MPVQSRLLRNHPFGDRGDADRDRDVADRTLQTSVGPGQPARGVCERHRGHHQKCAHAVDRSDSAGL